MANQFPVDPPFSTTDGTVTCLAPVYAASRGTLEGSIILYPSKPTAIVPSGGPAVVSVPITTPDGRPAVLADSGYCGDPTLEAKGGEAVVMYGASSLDSAVASGNGSLLVALSQCMYDIPGIYDVEGRMLDGVGNTIGRANAYVYVEPTVFQNRRMGPPKIDEVRSMIRDYPKANRLLGDYEFSNTEIAQAVIRSISRFNSAPPPLNGIVTSQTWPRDWVANLLDGIGAELFELAGAYFRRGHLPYSAGGLSIDDMAKERDYLTASTIYKNRWDYWVKMVRVNLNIEGGFSCLGSAYSYRFGA